MTRKHSFTVRLMLAGAVLVLVAFLGPRPAVHAPDVDAIARTIPADLAALPSYLAREEARVNGIHENTEKRIVWADSSVSANTVAADAIGTAHRKTRVAVVYIHGFSATRQETAPFSETLARELGANLFETRLTGHGLPGAALAGATAEDWMRDAAEALAIGQRLGDSVIVVATSTGGTLALWLATLPESQRRALAALVLISPNLAIKDPLARILPWPWMQQLLPRVSPSRQWTPRSPEQGRYWTTSYPTAAVFPLAGLVRYVRALDASRITVPTLVFVNPNDNVVDAAATHDFVIDMTKARVVQVNITPAEGEDAHVLVGRIVSPTEVRPFLDRTHEFLTGR